MKIKNPILVSDLDRTIIPNGFEPTSPQVLKNFKKIIKQHQITLVYVTGRDLGLVKRAIKHYGLPIPGYIIGNVGTSVYLKNKSGFAEDTDWTNKILASWQGNTREDLEKTVGKIKGTSLQEKSKQKRAKLSYYTDLKFKPAPIVAQVRARIKKQGIKATVIFSIDQIKKVGLLDVLPRQASKIHALRYLSEKFGFKEEKIVCAGDSGNDIDLLTGGHKAIVVKNARTEVKAEIKKQAQKKKISKQIYYAQGGFRKMNGNYAAGVLEGLHYFDFI